MDSKNKIVDALKGEKVLLLGNEAIVRGAIEAGVRVATGYPGTPASEIGDTFSKIASRLGIYFEYSINEKVAFEVAYGASFGGVRAIASMKHLGLNVAADPFVTAAYTGTAGGLVVISAGEPGCHTSPNEQDHRFMARMAKVPAFVPSYPAEAYEMTKIAFELSERWKLPILMIPTTRVSHVQGIVEVGEIVNKRGSKGFQKHQSRFVPVPATARKLSEDLIERIKFVITDLDCRKFNRVEGDGNKLAIVTTGVSYLYAIDAIEELGIRDDVVLLKIGIPYPLNDEYIVNALKGVEKILVVEELEPFLEDSIKRILFDKQITKKVSGKEDGKIPLAGELSPNLVREAIRRELSNKVIVGKGISSESTSNPTQVFEQPLASRPPILCPGCPHRASFLMLKLVCDEENDIFINDIGCYTLGGDPPFRMADMLLAMGTSISGGMGVSIATRKKVIAFIGDSTFFHSGITGLLNAVMSKHDILIVILDNEATAMTGHQPSPSDLKGSFSIEGIVKACGVENVAVVDPMDVSLTNRVIREFYNKKGVSVIISKHPCPFVVKGEKEEIYTVKEDRCRVCGISGKEPACGENVSSSFSLSRARRRIVSNIQELIPRGRAPCSEACPAGLCIQGFITQCLAGDMESAYRIIRRALPLPAVLSRICPRPCENSCVRKDLDDAVAINDLKRFVLDEISDSQKRKFLESMLGEVKFHETLVAVIGSGPAGLSAAWELRMRGYDVTIFEKEVELGGLLRYGIPRFRLPEDVLEKDIEEIIASGVAIQKGVEIGKDLKIEDLKSKFSAVFLATGAGSGFLPDIEGIDEKGIWDAIKFMKFVAENRLEQVEGNVIVIGGGDAAMDSARTALRLGGSKVTVVYRRSREEMPAGLQEIREAEKEGVEFIFRAAPVKIVRDGKGVLKVQFNKTIKGEIDETERARPILVSGSGFEIEAKTVVFATGQIGGGKIQEIEPLTLRIGSSNLFAGGDVLTGPATVVEAIAGGRRGAWGIDSFLRKGDAPPLYPGIALKGSSKTRIAPSLLKGVEKAERVEVPSKIVEKLEKNFDEVHGKYDRDLFWREAQRCLACGDCALCNSCIAVFGCGAFRMSENGKMQIDESLCNGCGVCSSVCPNGAIVKKVVAETSKEAIEIVNAHANKIRNSAFSSSEIAIAKNGSLRIHLAGVGGQGTLTAASIIGESALRSGIQVTVSALHGMAQRGGMVTNQIIMGNLRSPKIDEGEADIIAGLEPLETLRSLQFGKNGCIVFINLSEITPFTLTSKGEKYPDIGWIIEKISKRTSLLYTLNATGLAEKAGNRKSAQLVMLGFMVGAGVFPFSYDILRNVIQDISPPKRVMADIGALTLGFETAKKLV